MAAIKMKVSLTDREPITVKVPPLALIEAEEQFATTFVKMFSDLSLGQLSWLAWKSMLLTGHDVKTFDLFKKDLAEIPELVSTEDEAPLLGA